MYIYLFQIHIKIYVSNRAYKMSRKVSYIYEETISNFQFSKDHFMKPRRIKLTHSLVNTFNLFDHLQVIQGQKLSAQQLSSFHHPDYVKYLQTWITPNKSNSEQVLGTPLPSKLANQNSQKAKKIFQKDVELGYIFKVNYILDCPGFEGLYEFCQLAAGTSVDAANCIITGLSDIVINWAGGYHHAKKNQASGFCYVNDIVLCILQLLKFYPRVLYLDIDVHHGDGVQQAFYNTNRVMTVSFHQYGPGFFPETGSLNSVGEGKGKYYKVNVPLEAGIDDASYIYLFKRVMDRVIGFFVPDVLVIQCGADSISKDRLGNLNLSIKGHGECLSYLKGLNIPMILLGGGGYTIENVARCWAYETGLMLGHDIGDNIPRTDPFIYYYMKDNGRIHFDIQKVQNKNSKAYLDYIVQTVSENMRKAESRPSVQFHSIPRNQSSQFRVEQDNQDKNYQNKKFYSRF